MTRGKKRLPKKRRRRYRHLLSIGNIRIQRPFKTSMLPSLKESNRKLLAQLNHTRKTTHSKNFLRFLNLLELITLQIRTLNIPLWPPPRLSPAYTALKKTKWINFLQTLPPKLQFRPSKTPRKRRKLSLNEHKICQRS